MTNYHTRIMKLYFSRGSVGFNGASLRVPSVCLRASLGAPLVLWRYPWSFLTAFDLLILQFSDHEQERHLSEHTPE